MASQLLSFLFHTAPKLLVCAVLLSAVAGLSTVALLALIINSITKGTGQTAYFWPQFLFLCTSVVVTRGISFELVARISPATVYNLRLTLAKMILCTPLRRLEEIGSTRLVAALSEDAATVAEAPSRLVSLCLSGLVVIGLLAYLAWLSLSSLLLIIAIIAGGATAHLAIAHKVHEDLRCAHRKWDDIAKNFNALVLGAKELKLNAQRRQRFINGTFANAMRDWDLIVLRGKRLSIVGTGFASVLFFITVGIYIGLAETQTMDQSTAIAFVFAIVYIMAPLEGLMTNISLFVYGTAAFSRVSELRLSLETHRDEDDLVQTPIAPAWSRIELTDVHFGYTADPGRPRLGIGPICLTLTPGELLFITGGNGSGKTTLAKIVTGLYFPHAGSISLDGQPVTEAYAESYRQLFSAIFSDFHVLDTPIEPWDEAEGLQYSRRLNLRHQLGSAGQGAVADASTLSQGERKRLALLLAFMENRSIYVFDEWAADQDPGFKRTFYRVLLPELKRRGKAVVAISHDEAYYDVADRVLKLTDGKIEPYENVPESLVLAQSGA